MRGERREGGEEGEDGEEERERRRGERGYEAITSDWTNSFIRSCLSSRPPGRPTMSMVIGRGVSFLLLIVTVISVPSPSDICGGSKRRGGRSGREGEGGYNSVAEKEVVDIHSTLIAGITLQGIERDPKGVIEVAPTK